jgi:hypothetical protein
MSACEKRDQVTLGMHDAINPHRRALNSVDDDMLSDWEAAQTTREFVSGSADFWVALDFPQRSIQLLGIAIPLLPSPSLQRVLENAPNVAFRSWGKL